MVYFLLFRYNAFFLFSTNGKVIDQGAYFLWTHIQYVSISLKLVYKPRASLGLVQLHAICCRLYLINISGRDIAWLVFKNTLVLEETGSHLQFDQALPSQDEQNFAFFPGSHRHHRPCISGHGSTQWGCGHIIWRNRTI